MARGQGLEPRFSVPETDVLPLDDPRIFPFINIILSVLSILFLSPSLNSRFLVVITFSYLKFTHNNHLSNLSISV